jgi:hypothetical protein
MLGELERLHVRQSEDPSLTVKLSLAKDLNSQKLHWEVEASGGRIRGGSLRIFGRKDSQPQQDVDSRRSSPAVRNLSGRGALLAPFLIRNLDTNETELIKPALEEHVARGV